MPYVSQWESNVCDTGEKAHASIRVKRHLKWTFIDGINHHERERFKAVWSFSDLQVFLSLSGESSSCCLVQMELCHQHVPFFSLLRFISPLAPVCEWRSGAHVNGMLERRLTTFAHLYAFHRLSQRHLSLAFCFTFYVASTSQSQLKFIMFSVREWTHLCLFWLQLVAVDAAECAY